MCSARSSRRAPSLLHDCFFFQAEDGIRDGHVTGVKTCALPILMENSPEGAGMGTSGFVGQILTLTSMGFTAENLLSIGILHLAGPALISLVVSSWMRRKGWIRSGDMFLKTGK